MDTLDSRVYGALQILAESCGGNILLQHKAVDRLRILVDEMTRHALFRREAIRTDPYIALPTWHKENT